MAELMKLKGLWLAAVVSAIVVAALAIWVVLEQQPAEQLVAEHRSKLESTQSEPLTGSAEQPKKTDAQPLPGLKTSLNDVIEAARTWAPAFKSWFGKPAPDFTLTDITGQQHRLSDYRGKNVMIIFWASWCGPCRMEIPHLIELRKTVGQDKLAMLAISNEDPARVRKFVAEQKINYTVLSNLSTMPSPFDSVNSIPCSFFINPEGKIELATIGMLSLGEIKAILQAK